MTDAGQEPGELTHGRVVGPYRLIRRLGAGATGFVFEVEHQRIARRAALKILVPNAAFPGVDERLVVEAQAVNAINDPHVVEITDILETANGRPVALVMELLEGKSVADLLDSEPRLPLVRALRILAQVCDGLAAVHAAGFAHRDVKPENIFLIERNGDIDFVKLLDFGLVKALDSRRSTTRTQAGTFLGSPAYASPEQAAGETVDCGTDIYSLGVMAYELVSGTLPFTADRVQEVLLQQVMIPAPHLPAEVLDAELGRRLDEIIQTCLAKRPADRVFSARQLAEIFRELAETAEVVPGVSEVGRGETRFRRASRRRRLALPLALGALGLSLLAYGAVDRLAETATLERSAIAQLPQQVEAPVRAQACEHPVQVQTAPARTESLVEAEIQPQRPKPPHAVRMVRHLTEATTVDPYR